MGSTLSDRQVEGPDPRFPIGRRGLKAPRSTVPGSRGGGRRHRLPKAYAVAARRLPVRPAAHHPACRRARPFIGACNSHGISRLPQVEGEASARAQTRGLSDRLFSYRHRRSSEPRRANSACIVAIDRTSKFDFVELHEKVARRAAGNFLRRLIAAVPHKIHTVLADNRTHFTTPGNTGSVPDIKATFDAREPV